MKQKNAIIIKGSTYEYKKAKDAFNPCATCDLKSQCVRLGGVMCAELFGYDNYDFNFKKVTNEK